MRITTAHNDVRGHWAPLLQRWKAVVCIGAAMAIVFTIDRTTGVPHVQHLYYFPIVFAAIRFGMKSGIAVAAAAILLYHLANPHVLSWRYEEFDVMQMAVFVATGFVAAKSAADARRLHTLAMTDDLTGLHNLRSFEHHLQLMVRAARRDKRAIAVLVIDVDRLKRLNDAHGHLAGAEAVRSVGRIIAAHVPPDAVACRYGGDEFVIAVSPCDTKRALLLADDLRDTVDRTALTLAGSPFPPGIVSVSIGLACRTFPDPVAATAPDDVLGEELFRAADTALYASKNGGRNRVTAAPVAEAACQS
jgi:two-component system cell cycle response regulator